MPWREGEDTGSAWFRMRSKRHGRPDATRSCCKLDRRGRLRMLFIGRAVFRGTSSMRSSQGERNENTCFGGATQEEIQLPKWSNRLLPGIQKQWQASVHQQHFGPK